MNLKLTGLTISELVVSITLSSVLILALIPILFHMSSLGNVYQASGNQISGLQRAIDTIKSDIEIANRFLDQSHEDSNTPRSSSSNRWEFTSSPRTLILRLPATTKPYLDPTRELVFNADSGECTLTSNNNLADPVYVQVVYYIHKDNLYRRTIPPATYNACGNAQMAQVKSCLPDDGCELEDIHLAYNISSLEVEYFLNPEDAEPDSEVFEKPPEDAALQETPYMGVEIKLESTVPVGDEISVHTLTLRDTLGGVEL